MRGARARARTRALGSRQDGRLRGGSGRGGGRSLFNVLATALQMSAILSI